MTMSMMGAPSPKYFKAMRFRGFGEKRELLLSCANVQEAERAIRGFCHGHAHVFQQGTGFAPHERRHLQLVGCEQSWNSRQMKSWATQSRRGSLFIDVRWWRRFAWVPGLVYSSSHFVVRAVGS